MTGLAPRVSLHIPWDKVDDFGALATHAKELGVSIGAINSNLFQDEDYKLGSLTHADERIRAKAVAHHLDCIAIMRETGSRDLKIWLPDGTNYAGQDSLRARQDRLADSLAQIYAALDDDQRLLLEYKFFEPYFYAMDIPDWGTSLLHCLALGERAQVVLDTGHHAPGTNIEFIVMQLLRVGTLGAFDFNSRYYADDDLVVGSADPFQLFRILNEIVAVGAHRPGVRGQLHARPVPQHRGEDPRPDPLGAQRRAGAGQGAAGRPRRAGRRRSEAGDVLGAHGVLMDAYETDVRGAAGRPARGPRPAARPDGRLRRVRATSSGSPPSASAAPRPAGVPDTGPPDPPFRRLHPTGASPCPTRRHHDRRTAPSPSSSPARTGWAPTRATPTTPAATPPRRAPRPTR